MMHKYMYVQNESTHTNSKAQARQRHKNSFSFFGELELELENKLVLLAFFLLNSQLSHVVACRALCAAILNILAYRER
jgi:hypothetical protein